VGASFACYAAVWNLRSSNDGTSGKGHKPPENSPFLEPLTRGLGAIFKTTTGEMQADLNKALKLPIYPEQR
jgi:hypothetical protein